MRADASNLKEIPNIDLYNFDDISFLGNRYVLTSPRSLQACANLNIKPVDLLPKNRSDFEEEHGKHGAKKMERLFSSCEKDRRDKLFKARLERMRLVRMENQLDSCRNIDLPLNQYCGEDSCKEYFRHFDLPLELSRSQPIQPSLTPGQYSSILNRLSPSDLKRIKLAEDRYQRSCPQMRCSNPSRRMTVTGTKVRPHSSKARFAVGDKANCPNDSKGDNLDKRYDAKCSLVKESDYWLRRRAQESSRNDSMDRLKQSLEDKNKKTELNREQQLKERQRQLINSHADRERKLQQAHERRKELNHMLEAYHRELHELREQTQEKARQRALCRRSVEKRRLVEEHRQREQKVKANYKQVQQREEEWRKMAESIQKQKQENIQRFLEEREIRIQESRSLALQAERLREEMLRVYNLDSFDKKVQRVALVNEMGLGGAN